MMKKQSQSTLTSIAKLAQVTPGAVSVALSGKSGTSIRLSEEKRIRIRQLARELGYRPHGGARSARLQSFNNIGVVVAKGFSTESLHLRSFSLSTIQGINDALLEHNYCMSLVQVVRLPQLDRENWPRLLSESRVDGLIVTDVVPTELKEFIQRAGLPALWVNTNLKEPNDCIVFDDVGGARNLTGLMIERGHRRIAFLRSATDLHCYEPDRYDGFIQALTEAGIKPYPNQERLIPDNEREAFIHELLSRPDRPTAIISSNYQTAAMLNHILYARRLRIPDDISVGTWFDDLNQRQLFTPLHPAVITDNYQTGRFAVEMLMEKILHDNRPVPSRTITEKLCEE
jgi:LacI family transcriptional regulator